MNFRLIVLTSLFFCSLSQGFSQQECDLESYYNNNAIFRVDSVYKNVRIDGQLFTIKVLSDRMDEYLEFYTEEQMWEWNDAPKTLVFYDQKTRKMVFAKKYDFAVPQFEKAGKDVSKEGRLYLRWFSSGGGSGYLLDFYLVHLENGKITVSDLFTTNELDLVLYHKDDQRIYVLQGIWDMSEDDETGDFETHFSDHKYEVVECHFDGNELVKTSLGVTEHKYASLDEEKPVKEIFREIQLNEKIIPSTVNVDDLLER